MATSTPCCFLLWFTAPGPCISGQLEAMLHAMHALTAQSPLSPGE